MLFTRIPQQYAPLGGELRYAVSQETAGNIDIRIVDAAAGSAAGIGAAVSPGGADRAGTRGPVGDGSALLGAKRFAAVAEAAFDAAPYLRRRLHFTPATGRTGFYPAEGRTVTAVVEVAGTEGEAAAAIAPARTILPGDAPGTPGLRTSMPLVRLIPEDACDELTLLTDGPCIVTVTAEAGDTATAESYRASEAGLHLFRLDLREFTGAERLPVDAVGQEGTQGAVVEKFTVGDVAADIHHEAAVHFPQLEVAAVVGVGIRLGVGADHAQAGKLKLVPDLGRGFRFHKGDGGILRH